MELVDDSYLREARRLARLVPQWASADIDVKPLAGGITNRNFVASVGGLRFVLRLPGERTELLGISRRGEAQAARRAAALGFGPPVHGELPEAGTLITSLVGGHHPSSEQLAERLDEVARLLRRVHGSGPLESTFPIHRVVERHGSDASAQGVAPPAAYQGLLRQSQRIEQAFARSGRFEAPCHNDLLPANLLFDADRIWLLDFEYAGMNNPFFDLANLSVNAGLDQRQDERLLRAYFDNITHRTWARLQLMKAMSEFREGMWGVVQQAVSRLDNDFVSYAEQRLANCERMVNAPEFDAWIEQAGESAAS